MRETRTDNTLSPPLVRVRADSELALASLLGLGGSPSAGTRPSSHPMGAVRLVWLLIALGVVLALVSLGALV